MEKQVFDITFISNLNFETIIDPSSVKVPWCPSHNSEDVKLVSLGLKAGEELTWTTTNPTHPFAPFKSVKIFLNQMTGELEKECTYRKDWKKYEPTRNAQFTTKWLNKTQASWQWNFSRGSNFILLPWVPKIISYDKNPGDVFSKWQECEIVYRKQDLGDDFVNLTTRIPTAKGTKLRSKSALEKLKVAIKNEIMADSKEATRLAKEQVEVKIHELETHPLKI